MKRQRLAFGIALVFALAVLLARLSAAQESRGTILGVVSDSSGARVPGVMVTITNVGTNVPSTSLSNEQGYYEVPFLLPGKYKVEAELAGFKKFIQDGITLQVNDRPTINITLEVGGSNEVVSITAGAPLLESSTASSGTVIDNKRINELPLTDMNPFVLASLAPGVTWNGTPEFRRAFDNNGTSAISVGGAGNRQNEWSVDGIPNTQGNRVAYVPPTDAVQEFKIEATSFDASSGHGAGGTVNVSIKSGTNQLHGTGYELFRNNRTNATDWFVNRSYWDDVNNRRTSASEERQRSGRYNQFGFTVGGPVVLPKIYKGKDKTFFFFSYNGIYQLSTEPSFYRMPTEAERNGNFSELLARGGSAYQIYDPTSARLVGNTVTRTPFDGNIINPTRISNIAKNYFKYYPLPNNSTGVGVDFSNNYFAPNQRRGDDFYSLTNRLDHVITSRHRIFGRWNYNNRLEDRSDWTGTGLMSNGLVRINTGIGVDDVYTINPRNIVNVTLGWSRFADGNKRRTDGIDIGSLGFPSYLKDRAGDLQHLPRIQISGMPDLGASRSNVSPQHIYASKGSLLRVQGNHSLKTGVDYRVYQRNTNSKGFPGGTFSFNNSFTRATNTTTAQQSGLAFAAFLLGFPSSGSVDTNDSFAEQNKFIGVFFQDDWRIIPKLTLNIGLRYEYEGPISERYSRFAVDYDFNTPSPISSAATAAYLVRPITELAASQFKVMGGPTFAGVNGARNTTWNGDKNNFMPRIGASYKVTEKMVLRAGYGMYFASNLGVQNTNVFQFGYSQGTPLIATTDNGLTFIGMLADPFPAIQSGGVRFITPPGNSLGLSQNLGLGYQFYNADAVNPYQHRWRVGLQYQLSRDVVMEAAYVGSVSRDALSDTLRDGNTTSTDDGILLSALPEQFWANGYVRDNATATLLTASVANPFQGLIPGTGLNGSTVQRQVLLRPFPHMNGLRRNGIPDGKSSYHSLEARLEKRFSKGWTVLTSFTKVKQIDQTLRINQFDTTLDKIISGDDRTHRLVVSGIYEFPFGKGRKYGSDLPWFLNAFAGGWQVGAIYQYQTGEPLAFGNLFYKGCTCEIYTDSARNVDRAFNTDNFVKASGDQPAAFHRRVFPFRPDNRLRRDKLNLWDMNIVKNIIFSEETKLQLKVDLLNTFNHPLFTSPTTSPISSNFGKITGMWGLPRVIQFNIHFVF